MSTNRAGDPTATQSPSAPPTPGAVPTQALPADGDALTAASIAQALKVIADFEAWQKSPRAQAASGTSASNWAEAIQLWKSARLHSRFAVDHMGFPAGKFVQWQEDWMGKRTSASASTPAQDLIGRWVSSALFTNGACDQYNPANNELRAPAMGLTISSTTNDMTRLHTRLVPVKADADTAMVLQWDCCPHSGTLASLEHAGGLIENSYATALTGSSFTTDLPNGCAFIRRTTDTNWFVYTKNGGSAAYFDTGVAAVNSTPVRFRIETVGANVGDDSTARAIFYVNGVFKTAVAVATVATPVPMFSVSNPGSGGARFDIGMVDFRASVWSGSLIF